MPSYVQAGAVPWIYFRSIVQMVMDACGALGLLLLALYSVRIVAFGKAGDAYVELSTEFQVF